MTRWKPSSCSIGTALRANGAKADWPNIESWYLPTRSPQLCQEKTFSQLSFTLNISRSASPRVARRGATFVAEISDEEIHHLPAVTRLFRHVPREAVAVVLGGRAIEQRPRLL